MLRSPLVFTARSGSALTTFAPVVLDCSNEEKECALAHAFGRVVIGRRSCSTPRLHKAFLQEQGARLLRSLLLALIAMPDPAGCGKRERLDQRGDRFISTLVGYDWHRSLAVVIGKTFRLFCLVFIPIENQRHQWTNWYATGLAKPLETGKRRYKKHTL